MPGLGSSIELTQVTEWADGVASQVEDYLAAEEPLEIRLGNQPLTVVMRTPGDDLELTAGFLWTEGLIEQQDQIEALRQTRANHNVVEVDLSGAVFDSGQRQRNFLASSGCGLCGKVSLDGIENRQIRPPNPEFKVEPESLCQLPERLRAGQKVFGRTGGLHAAALFDDAGELIALREDIGRHNAVDKVVGWALLSGRLPLSRHVLMVSGRGGFEIVQKALAAGIPLLASVSAPSSLAVKLARRLGLTLVGFVRGRRFVVYSGPERCLSTPLGKKTL
jgi:FdhD protein